MPIHRLHLERSAPGRKTRPEGNVGAQPPRASHRIVGEQLRLGLDDEFLLRPQPPRFHRQKFLHAEERGRHVIQTEGHQPPTGAARIARRIEQAVAIDHVVRIRVIAGLAPAHLAESRQAADGPPPQRLGQIQPGVEGQFLGESISRPALAGQNPEIKRAPTAPESQPVILRRRTHPEQIPGHRLRPPPTRQRFLLRAGRNCRAQNKKAKRQQRGASGIRLQNHAFKHIRN